MKLVSFTKGHLVKRVGVIVGDKVYDVNSIVRQQLAEKGEPFAREMADLVAPSSMRRFLEAGDRAMDAARSIERAVSNGQEYCDASWPLSSVRLETPVPDPEKIICLSHNYKDFIAETGVPTPPAPRIFSKYVNALCGPEDPIIYPPETKELGYEAELAFIVGKPARRVPIERALEYIAGYTVFNDVSASDLTAMDIQVLRGKTFDNFAPAGPYLVTGDEVGDPGTLDITLWVNDRVLQKSNTSQLLYDVPFLLSFISNHFTLKPGDIVATGTPGGLAKYRKPPTFMKVGDVCTIEIERVGRLSNVVVAESSLTRGCCCNG